MSLTYYLRQKLKWPGRPFADRPFIAGSKPPTDRGRELFELYDLSRWSGRVSRSTFKEMLGTLDLLDRLPIDVLSDRAFLRQSAIRAIDVGAKNWRYAGALSAWLDRHAPAAERIQVTGVEVDAFRLYADLRTRFSYGKHFSRLCTSGRTEFRYEAMDVRNWQGTAHLITWFFPFVSEAPHRAWGLPRSLFRPGEVFQSVESAVAPGGTLVMTNQGDWEWERARSRMGSLRLRYQEVIEGSLHPSSYPIFLTVWTRDA